VDLKSGSKRAATGSRTLRRVPLSGHTPSLSVAGLPFGARRRRKGAPLGSDLSFMLVTQYALDFRQNYIKRPISL